MSNIRYITESLTWIGFFIAVFLSVYFYFRLRHKERMALIEKGIDVSEIYKGRDITFKFPWLRLGILILGIGLGMLVAYILLDRLPMPTGHPYYQDSRDIILIFSLLIFGGLGLILGNVFERLGKKKNG